MSSSLLIPTSEFSAWPLGHLDSVTVLKIKKAIEDIIYAIDPAIDDQFIFYHKTKPILRVLLYLDEEGLEVEHVKASFSKFNQDDVDYSPLINRVETSDDWKHFFADLSVKESYDNQFVVVDFNCSPKPSILEQIYKRKRPHDDEAVVVKKDQLPSYVMRQNAGGYELLDGNGTTCVADPPFIVTNIIPLE